MMAACLLLAVTTVTSSATITKYQLHMSPVTKMATCLPSMAPMQFGKLHLRVNSYAMKSHSFSVCGICTYTAKQTVVNYIQTVDNVLGLVGGILHIFSNQRQQSFSSFAFGFLYRTAYNHKHGASLPTSFTNKILAENCIFFI